MVINVQRNIVAGEPVAYTDAAGIKEGESLNRSESLIDSRYIGQIHTHPAGTYPMFSWLDLRALRNKYNGANTPNKEFIFLMIVNDNGSVYALQVSDFDALNDRIESDCQWALENKPNDPLGYLDEVLEELFATSSDGLENVFLQKYGNTGIKLLKEADESLTEWEELLASNGDVLQVPCE